MLGWEGSAAAGVEAGRQAAPPLPEPRCKRGRGGSFCTPTGGWLQTQIRRKPECHRPKVGKPWRACRAHIWHVDRAGVAGLHWGEAVHSSLIPHLIALSWVLGHPRTTSRCYFICWLPLIYSSCLRYCVQVDSETKLEFRGERWECLCMAARGGGNGTACQTP